MILIKGWAEINTIRQGIKLEKASENVTIEGAC